MIIFLILLLLSTLAQSFNVSPVDYPLWLESMIYVFASIHLVVLLCINQVWAPNTIVQTNSSFRVRKGRWIGYGLYLAHEVTNDFGRPWVKFSWVAWRPKPVFITRLSKRLYARGVKRQELRDRQFVRIEL